MSGSSYTTADFVGEESKRRIVRTVRKKQSKIDFDYKRCELFFK